MAKYDGLIIPRSYSDYLNKTDGATLSQMLDSLGGTLDAAPTANSAKAARSGGIFASNAVITSDNATLTGVAISAGSVVRVLFTAALTGSDAETGLTLTYNGNTYAVKVGKDGALVALTAHLIEESYIYLQAYTTLELAFDGSQFVVMGNPVVISNADFSIMADGSITYSKENILTGVTNWKPFNGTFDENTQGVSGYVRVRQIQDGNVYGTVIACYGSYQGVYRIAGSQVFIGQGTGEIAVNNNILSYSIRPNYGGDSIEYFRTR